MTVPGGSLGKKSMFTRCPNCHKDIHTKTNSKAGTMAYLVAGGMAFAG